MSFIRPAQDGTYVEIPGGSNYYIYGDGETINGWSYGEFAALIGSVVDEIDWIDDGVMDARTIKQHFANHFGGWDGEYDGGITPPERAEIFCQCVDRRIDMLELTDELHDAVSEWADDFDTLRECQYCGKEFRPVLYSGGEYVCDNEECSNRNEAESLSVDVSVIRQGDALFEWLYYEYDYNLEEASAAVTDYLFTKSPERKTPEK